MSITSGVVTASEKISRAPVGEKSRIRQSTTLRRLLK
jgi:hypothetical protein